MLDQNTDRMWYVIGAVLIGAAIIFGMNTLMPNAFASVGHSMENVIDKIEIALGNSQVILPDELTTVGSGNVRYDEESKVWTVELTPYVTDWYSRGFRVVPRKIIVPYGETLHGEYWVKVPRDTHVRTDINAYAMEGSNWRGVDNDNNDSRRFNGIKPVVDVDYTESQNPHLKMDVPPNEWVHVTWKYTNDDPLNVDKVDLYDMTDFGAVNLDGEPMDIQIRDIKITVTGN